MSHQSDFDKIIQLLRTHRGRLSARNELLQMLKKNRDLVNMRDISGKTPLMIACLNYGTNANREIIDILLENDANINDIGRCGNTSLMMALTRLTHHNKTIKLLLDNDADVNIANNNGYYPLTVAVRGRIPNKKEVVELLLDNMHDIDIPDKHGHTMMMLSDEYNIINLLLDHGANINHVNINGYTKIMMVCSLVSNDIDIAVIKLLLDRGANVDIISSKHETALILFCKCEILHVQSPESVANICMELIHKSKKVIFHQIHGRTAYDLYMRNRYTFLNEDQIEYLRGNKICTTIKKAI